MKQQHLSSLSTALFWRYPPLGGPRAPVGWSAPDQQPRCPALLGQLSFDFQREGGFLLVISSFALLITARRSCKKLSLTGGALNSWHAAALCESVCTSKWDDGSRIDGDALSTPPAVQVTSAEHGSEQRRWASRALLTGRPLGDTLVPVSSVSVPSQCDPALVVGLDRAGRRRAIAAITHSSSAS